MSSVKKAEKTVKQVVQQTESSVDQAAQDLQDRVDDFAKSAHAAVDTTVDTVGDTVSRTASSLSAAAANLADASQAMRENEIGQLGRDISDLARRNPVVFAGGALLLGYAVARSLADARTK